MERETLYAMFAAMLLVGILLMGISLVLFSFENEALSKVGEVIGAFSMVMLFASLIALPALS